MVDQSDDTVDLKTLLTEYRQIRDRYGLELLKLAEGDRRLVEGIKRIISVQEQQNQTIAAIQKALILLQSNFAKTQNDLAAIAENTNTLEEVAITVFSNRTTVRKFLRWQMLGIAVLISIAIMIFLFLSLESSGKMAVSQSLITIAFSAIVAPIVVWLITGSKNK